jgi:hypothetical protein
MPSATEVTGAETTGSSSGEDKISTGLHVHADAEVPVAVSRNCIVLPSLTEASSD